MNGYVDMSNLKCEGGKNYLFK